MGGGAHVEEGQPDWAQEEEEVAPENDHGGHLDIHPRTSLSISTIWIVPAWQNSREWPAGGRGGC